MTLDFERLNYDVQWELFETHCSELCVSGHLEENPKQLHLPIISYGITLIPLSRCGFTALLSTSTTYYFEKKTNTRKIWKDFKTHFRDNKVVKTIQLDCEPCQK